MATGTCPLDDASGTMIMAIDTIGNYSLGNFSNATGWTEITYVPDRFYLTILKDNKQVYYTTVDPGECLYPLTLWNDELLGCPCNGTWEANGSYNTTSGRFDGGRVIRKSECENGTCPDSFFLDDSVLYGNIRLINHTNEFLAENISVSINGTDADGVFELKLTATSRDSATGFAFGDDDIKYEFVSSGGSCLQSVDPEVTIETTTAEESDTSSTSTEDSPDSAVLKIISTLTLALLAIQ
jgi:hypothetical protein